MIIELLIYLVFHNYFLNFFKFNILQKIFLVMGKENELLHIVYLKILVISIFIITLVNKI